MNVALITAVLAISGLSHHAVAAGDAPLLDVDAIVGKLRSPPDAQEAQLMEIQLLRERSVLCKRLTALVADATRDEACRIQAARLLGELRLSEATDVLLDHIGLSSTVSFDRGWPTGYPCEHALLLISKPASREILRRLATDIDLSLKGKPVTKDTTDRFSRDVIRVQAFCRVLNGVEGEKLAEHLLTTEMKKASGRHKQTLEILLRLRGGTSTMAIMQEWVEAARFRQRGTKPAEKPAERPRE